MTSICGKEGLSRSSCSSDQLQNAACSISLGREPSALLLPRSELAHQKEAKATEEGLLPNQTMQATLVTKRPDEQLLLDCVTGKFCQGSTCSHVHCCNFTFLSACQQSEVASHTAAYEMNTTLQATSQEPLLWQEASAVAQGPYAWHHGSVPETWSAHHITLCGCHTAPSPSESIRARFCRLPPTTCNLKRQTGSHTETQHCLSR